MTRDVSKVHTTSSKIFFNGRYKGADAEGGRVTVNLKGLHHVPRRQKPSDVFTHKKYLGLESLILQNKGYRTKDIFVKPAVSYNLAVKLFINFLVVPFCTRNRGGHS